MSLAVAGAIAAPAILGYMGQRAASGDRKAAMAQMQAIYDQINAIPVPEERALRLEQLQSAGVLSPEMVQEFKLQDSELQGISLDPKLREAQMAALSGLQERADSGLTLADRARLNQAMQEVGTRQKGMRDAALQELRRRGMGGSGMELSAALQAQQQGAQDLNQIAMQQEAMSQQQALESLINAGGMAGAMRSQDFGEQAKIAEAQDAINRFNLANRQGVASENTASRNAAQAANLQNKQNIMSQNVGLRNQQMQYNLAAPQRQYENQLAKMGTMTGAGNNLANLYANQAAQKQAMYSGMGQAAGQGFGTYAQYQLDKEEMNRKYPEK